ncbi:hypothetical protein M433DRAFT_156423 [Acidomyces richmondensis BFW]|nr:MAG: hypothetical protein FE78DRAFT_85323 [Acidomyces sp. 'richmondensis']KYG43698.1 hypothetical protein M433DRAFT_156423 [Acidomyces richmondensis BFW]
MVLQSSPSLSQVPPTSKKKQQSISSFFAAKPAPSNASHALPPQSNRHQSPSSLQVDSLRRISRQGENEPSSSDEEDEEPINDRKRSSQKLKRTLNREHGHEDQLQPSSKRVQRTFDALAGDKREGKEEKKTAEQQSLVNRLSDSNDEMKKVDVTGRTSKYLFSSLPGVTSESNHYDIYVEDEETRRSKERLHQKFVKRLSRPDSIAEIKRRSRLILEERDHPEDCGEDEEELEAEAEPQSKGRGWKGPASKKNGTTKLTPLEKQVLDIKHKHPDTLLIVEVGYKFRFFGEDARIAAKELSIVCIPGKYRFDEHPSEAHLDRFASASVPVHRLHVHVKRLVSSGHKVGIVRQLETAALKAAGDNRNKAFERGLTNLYTKGTYIDEQEPLTAPETGSELSSGHLLCLTESQPKSLGLDEKVQIGLLAVQPSTGDIIYDDFEDGWMRSELETRLLHIAPCEFLLVGDMSKATEKLIQHLSGSKTNVFGDKARIERVKKSKTMAAQAYSHITSFYAGKIISSTSSTSSVESSQEKGTLLDKVHRLTENATICLSAMITYLTDYGLQHVFDLTKYFQSFSARSHMLLNGNTLTSLEIYRNQTDLGERGSLFWTLDRTKTRFGQRMLRKWVGRPLLDRSILDERMTAIEELKDNQQTAGVDRLKCLLGKTKGDLEKSLIRIYYKKCTRPELLAVLQTLQMIAREYVHVGSPAEAGFKSRMICEAIASMPKIEEDVVRYLDCINAQAAKTDDKFCFFRDEHETEDITHHKVRIASVEHDLAEFRKLAAVKLKKSQVDYVTVAGIDYLIELDNKDLKNLPASWIKISGTKKMSRFHAPEVVNLIRERDQHKEALANACDAAFIELLTEIGAKYEAFRDCIQSLALLDCLMSLADVASQPGYCRPEFSDQIGIEINQGRHPMVEQLLLDSFVPNDVNLTSGGTRALLITGPNMGGKSSYVRSVALIAIMAQIGSYVPAKSARLGLLDAVFTRMGAFDNMMKGESTFMVELSETSDILKQATPRSLVILDELGRGTSTHDGVAIAQAVLRYCTSELQSLTLFITHYQSLARLAWEFKKEGSDVLANVHMRFTERQNDQGEMDITFLYEVGEGVAHRSYGLNVARLAGLPVTLLKEARNRSLEMEQREAERRLFYLSKSAVQLLEESKPNDLEKIVACIEEL